MPQYAGPRALIDLDALGHNYQTLKEHIQRTSHDTRVIAVVKADAYGHGAKACTEQLLACGCRFFAVARIEEAVDLRQVCRAANVEAEILILGYTPPEYADVLAEHDVTQALLSPAYAQSLEKAAKTAHVCIKTHIATDTGMGRVGFRARSDEDVESTVDAIADTVKLPHLCVCGMFTHLANADGESEACRADTARQISLYGALKKRLEARGIAIPFHHMCNSAATAAACKGGDLPLFDAVRVGIALYGGAAELHKHLSLRPVMRLEADVTHLQPLKKGERAGYGGAYTAARDMTLAVVNVGYADGLLRSCSGATVLLRHADQTHEVPIVGRVCMDCCMLDVTGTDACVGDTVTLFGDTPERLSALSRHANTIDYELLCAASARVKRICKKH